MKILVALGVVGAVCTLADTASARRYNVDEAVSRYIACYTKVYVPAVVQVNTRGKLVRPATRSWEISGDRWDYVRDAAVYIQTRRIVEPDHYTLVSSACP